MRIMILGASGYLGSKLTSFFDKRGVQVTQVVRKIIKDSATPIGMIEATDICNELQSKKYNWVINCAAIYEKKDIDRAAIIDANMVFALRALEYTAISKTANFLTIDSSLPEELNLYSFTKKKFAEYGKFYAKNYDTNFVNVVLEMFYGEDEPDNRFFHKCYSDMISGNELLLTEGRQKRDIIHISDVCQGIEKIVFTDWSGYNDVPLGTGEAASVREMIEYMHRVLESKAKLNFGAIPLRKDEPNCISDISILRKKGFKPQYSWKEGLLHFCNALSREGENE